ncbi:MAG: SO_0444 family Cu/Zn efflux transporter [Fibrobacterales bacterium]
MDLLKEIVLVFVEMAPYLVFGFLFAGVLHVFVKKEVILKHLGASSVGSVIKASLFGVPLPLCSCSVIPTAISLKKSGASNASVLSFLLSTPLTGVDSIVATYGVLGPVFAIFRPIAAFLIGIIGGIVALFVKTDETIVVKGEESSCYSGDDAQKNTSIESCCSNEPETGEVKEGDSIPWLLRVVESIKEIWTYAFKTLLDDIALPLIVGVVISGVISWALPDNFFGDLALPTMVQMLIMIVVGVPIYICATASLPIGAALLLKGLSPGVIFVFLAAGPVTNSATIALIIKQFGKKFFALYFGVIAVLSIAFGLLLDGIIETFGYVIEPMMGHHGEHGPSVLFVAIAVGFVVLLMGSLKRKFIPKKRENGSCCSQ